MKMAPPTCRLQTTSTALLVGVLITAQAAAPVVPENVKTTVRQPVDYGYCPGVVVGLMNTNGSTCFCHGSVDLDGGPAVDEHTLFESGANRFYLTFPEAGATFLTNALGHATNLVRTQTGATTTYPKVRLPSSLALRRVEGITQLCLSGDTDRDYVIQASKDLVHWLDLSTNTIWGGPIIDAESTAFDHRFYRVLEP